MKILIKARNSKTGNNAFTDHRSYKLDLSRFETVDLMDKIEKVIFDVFPDTKKIDDDLSTVTISNVD